MKSLLKQKLREKYKKIRGGIPKRAKLSCDADIARNFLSLPEIPRAAAIALYMSKGSEAGTRAIIFQLLRAKKTVCLPCVNAKKSQIKFRKIKNIGDCVKGPFGILEPNTGCPAVPAGKIDVIAVPGIVFDKKGFRLGYGKGFYDRLLQKAPKIFSAGLAYEKTLIASLPREKTDMPVSVIVTEKRIIRTR